MPDKSSRAPRSPRSSNGSRPVPASGDANPQSYTSVATEPEPVTLNRQAPADGTQAIAADDQLDTIKDERVQEYLDQRVIGDRIRSLRLKRSMGLIELGQRTGLSASFLSQLETGRVVPTLRNLARVALVFGKDLSWFFKDDKPVSFRMLKRSDRVRLVLDRKDASRFVSESLGALVPDRNIVPCLAEFHPKTAACEFTPKVFPGQEFVYLIEGQLSVSTSRQREQMVAGDVLWIDSATKRQYECSGEGTAHAMIITFPKD